MLCFSLFSPQDLCKMSVNVMFFFVFPQDLCKMSVNVMFFFVFPQDLCKMSVNVTFFFVLPQDLCKMSVNVTFFFDLPQVDGSVGSDSMVEHTLQHNETLTEFLSQVCTEKEELRVHLNKLEDELIQYRRNERHQQVRNSTLS